MRETTQIHPDNEKRMASCNVLLENDTAHQSKEEKIDTVPFANPKWLETVVYNKSNLVLRYHNDTFTAIGTDFRFRTVEHGKNVRIQTWDRSGDETMKSAVNMLVETNILANGLCTILQTRRISRTG
jgi:hypothetical protein